MTQIQMTKNMAFGFPFWTLEHWYFEFVSDFGFRASDLFTAKGLRWDKFL
jgi:hypothetical protein